MSELSHDYIKGILAGRDYEREITAKQAVCHHTRHTERPYCVKCDPVNEWLQTHTDRTHDSAIKDALEILEHKLVMIADVAPKVSTNAKILLEYQRKIVRELIKEITELL